MPDESQARAAAVTAVSCSDSHTFSKANRFSIRLVAGLGVEGDVHSGATVKHRSRVAKNSAQPNLRQIHLIHAELHEELSERGFSVGAGELGENITTRGIDLLHLPTGTRLHIGSDAIVEVTGLRTPCGQIDHFQKGLMAAVLDRDAAGQLIRKTGVMSIVLAGGDVYVGDVIRIELPAELHRRLEPV
ncbi:MAG: MOSC domain-containing protein [Candidatus Obscuribacterales bacterium]|nr:MOSC domain-containing protein [Steroidobacteraceae bacterium]